MKAKEIDEIRNNAYVFYSYFTCRTFLGVFVCVCVGLLGY
jgi:hypothetical protein